MLGVVRHLTHSWAARKRRDHYKFPKLGKDRDVSATAWQIFNCRKIWILVENTTTTKDDGRDCHFLHPLERLTGRSAEIAIDFHSR